MHFFGHFSDTKIIYASPGTQLKILETSVGNDSWAELTFKMPHHPMFQAGHMI
jgi:hypothetical protein